MLLNNKIAIVTGASGGLGLASARAFAEQGAKVVISDVTDDKGEAAAAALRADGFDVQYHHCDVTKKAEIQALVDETVKKHGRLDIMMANAGIVHACDPLELAEEDYDRVLAVNLKGVFLSGQLAARQMMTQQRDENGQRGVIVNMSSCQAVIVIPEIASYVMSKGGINQWTKALGIRLAPEGIRVNAIGPGSIATEMFKSIANDPQKMRNIMSRTPVGRPGEPSEIGSIAVFLASPMASYITGQTIYPDGGRLGLNYTVPVKD